MIRDLIDLFWFFRLFTNISEMNINQGVTAIVLLLLFPLILHYAYKMYKGYLRLQKLREETKQLQIASEGDQALKFGLAKYEIEQKYQYEKLKLQAKKEVIQTLLKTNKAPLLQRIGSMVMSF